MKIKTERGRPRTDKSEDVKKKLLKTAELLLRKKSYAEISIREIGKKAGVNSAMINYYFGDKKNLFREIIFNFYSPILKSLEAVNLENDDPIGTYISIVTEKMTSFPHLPLIITRESTLSSSPVGIMFREIFASKIYERLSIVVKNEIKKGKFRNDLNSDLTIISLVSLAITPHLPTPIKRFQEIRFELDKKEFINHTKNIFLNGVMKDGKNE